MRPTCEQQELSDDLFVPTKKLRFTNQHIPVFVAIHHNFSFLRSNSTQFFVNEDPQLLVDSFLDILLLLSEQNTAFQTDKFEDIVE